ncbi:hypothetical protein [Bacillus massilinigeriensis]|uniref:hypothetical protein n=1 Tax=Bacillus massilionigeriensis TaxID=1805475 RepID=UPI00096B0F21|nr:hypothetical protein [Bacillus massilionigeriensis]
MNYCRNPYNQRGFFFGVPFIGGLLGGLLGSALIYPRPRPFYPPFPYPPFPPYPPYGYPFY